MKYLFRIVETAVVAAAARAASACVERQVSSKTKTKYQFPMSNANPNLATQLWGLKGRFPWNQTTVYCVLMLTWVEN